MASLKFIMHVDDEQTEPPSSRSNKRDKEPPDPSDAGEEGQESSSSTRQQHTTDAAHHHTQRNLSPPAPASASGKRRAATNRASRSIPVASSSSTRPPTTRRRSTTSTDSMDQTGYASSSSMGGSGSGMGHPNQPIRPMPPNTSGPELPVKLTPITGRVSRAKKGLAVHTCEVCKPAKTFTRAEHLRRHQLSHQAARYQCTYPGCDRAFHRADLLTRHQQKHEQDGDKVSGRGGQDRRGSSQPSLGDDTRLGYPPSSAGHSSGLGASTPVSDVPATPNLNPSPGEHLSPGGSSTQHSSMSPNIVGRGSYDTYVPGSRQTSIIYPSNDLDHSISGPSGLSDPDYSVPRTPGTFPLFVVTEGLSTTVQPIDSNPPDLTHLEASPWASSTDSSYSNTPAADHVQNRGYSSWAQRPSPPPNDWAQQPYLAAPPTVQDPHNLHALATPYFYTSPISTHPNNHSSNFPLFDMSMAGLPSDTHAFTGGQTHLQNPPISSVGSPSPVTTSTITAETLVTPSPALPADHLGQLANLGRQKEMVMDVGAGVFGGIGMPWEGGNDSPVLAAAQGLVGMGGCGGPGMPLPMLTGTVRKAIPTYLDIYWDMFHVNYPIVHRPSFEAAPEDVLRCAMAAVATQFLDGAEDRRRGNQLHEYAWHEAKRCLQWSLQTMQAILICEMFARFRGRKVVIKPSRMFDALYSRVLDCDNSADPVAAVATFDPAQASGEQRWRLWIELEGRRRLLAGCFFLDVHTSVYYEQPRARHFNITPGPGFSIPLIKNTTPLWNSPSADAWALTLDSADPSAFLPSPFPDWSRLSPHDLASKAPFDRALILAAEAARSPKRSVVLRSEASSPITEPVDYPPAELNISRVFQCDPIANTYLALHHTPLQALLAVSGDTWLFSHKVLSHDTFQDHKKRLKIWAETHVHPPRAATAMSAPHATLYAARALDGFLADGRCDISDYWGAYVCALICWAFGHRAARSSVEASRAAEDEDVLAWLKSIGSQHVDEGFKIRGRKEAFGVVGLVRRRLEAECVGHRSRLFVDAVVVLKKLEENQATWF